MLTIGTMDGQLVFAASEMSKPHVLRIVSEWIGPSMSGGGSGSTGVQAQLTELDDLRAQGVISVSEHQEMRARLLGHGS